MGKENESYSNKKRIRELDSKFVDMSMDIVKGIRNAGAYSASLRLREIYPDLDWTAYPRKEDLEKQVTTETETTIKTVRDAIENRKNARLLEHGRELGGS